MENAVAVVIVGKRAQILKYVNSRKLTHRLKVKVDPPDCFASRWYEAITITLFDRASVNLTRDKQLKIRHHRHYHCIPKSLY